MKVRDLDRVADRSRVLAQVQVQYSTVRSANESHATKYRVGKGRSALTPRGEGLDEGGLWCDWMGSAFHDFLGGGDDLELEEEGGNHVVVF